MLGKAKKLVAKATIKVAKHSPTILTVVGTVGVVATAALAVRAGRRIDDALETAELEVAEAVESHVTVIDEMTIEQHEGVDGWDRIKITAKAYAPVVKLVAPVVLVGAASIASFWFGHQILKDRYLQAVAAYEGAALMLRNYRDRVAKEVGEDREQELFQEVSAKTTKEMEESYSGKARNPGMVPSYHAVLFDRSNPNWVDNREANEFFLRAKQTQFTNELHANGYLFLNDVLRGLGFNRTNAGQLVGWIEEKGEQLPYVDLGIHDGWLQSYAPGEGHAADIYLDFNIDGAIWERI